MRCHDLFKTGRGTAVSIFMRAVFGDRRGDWRKADQRYRASHPGYSNVSNRNFQRTHPDFGRTWRETNPGYPAQWKTANPLRWKALHHKALAIRDERLRGREQATPRQLLILFAQQDHCLYCKNELIPGHIHVDHMVPIALGGHGGITNLTLACDTCNLRKGKKTIKVFCRGESSSQLDDWGIT